MRIVTAVSRNSLDRMAEPASRYHRDYLAYKNNEITRAQLIDCLPHLAMIGDSLSRDVYISSPLSTLWRAHTRKDRDWFLNTDPSAASVYSVFERLEKFTPLVASEYGGIGAMIDLDKEPQSLFRRVLRTRNFSAQVDQVLSSKRFPDLILIWIGHNNVDWAWRCPPGELENPERRLHTQSHWFCDRYAQELRRLIARARATDQRVAIVIYGLADFESFFKARDAAEALRAADRNRFPKLGADFRYFVSMRPPYRSTLIRLVRMVNTGLSALAEELQRNLEREGVVNLQVRYSDALAKVDLSPVEVIHEIDGWHPSVEGHNRFAEAAFGSLQPSLQFLGITGVPAER